MHVAFTKMKSVLTETLVFSIVFRYAEMKMRYNTYPQQISRSTLYDPRVIRKSCLLKPDPGPCRGNIPMYNYDPKERNCTIFRWGGCQGNGNRFDSMLECRDTCLSKPDEKEKRPRYCNLSFDYGFCFGDIKRWYYDHLWKVCKQTIYSGCGGNKNNFYTMGQCESICRLGTGIITRGDLKHGGTKKVLIINPPNTTPARGKDQTVVTAGTTNTTETTKN